MTDRDVGEISYNGGPLVIKCTTSKSRRAEGERNYAVGPFPLVFSLSESHDQR